MDAQTQISDFTLLKCITLHVWIQNPVLLQVRSSQQIESLRWGTMRAQTIEPSCVVNLTAVALLYKEQLLSARQPPVPIAP